MKLLKLSTVGASFIFFLFALIFTLQHEHDVLVHAQRHVLRKRQETAVPPSPSSPSPTSPSEIPSPSPPPVVDPSPSRSPPSPSPSPSRGSNSNSNTNGSSNENRGSSSTNNNNSSNNNNSNEGNNNSNSNQDTATAAQQGGLSTGAAWGIAIAAIVFVGVVMVVYIVRKWKLKPSRAFKKRVENPKDIQLNSMPRSAAEERAFINQLY